MEYIKHFDKVMELSKDGAIATINFCCPENENRVHQQLADELYTALREVHYDSDIRVLVPAC